MVWFYMLTIPVGLFLMEATGKPSLLNLTRKLSGERCREGFSMNHAQSLWESTPKSGALMQSCLGVLTNSPMRPAEAD